MRKAARYIGLGSAALLMSLAVAAVEYYGYLTVNDEDYGYWEGQPMVFVEGKRTPLEDLANPITEPLEFELSLDLVQGLVRQYASRPAEQAVNSAAAMSATAAEAVDKAGAASPSQAPTGEGSWVRFGSFQTLGFGQYEDADATYAVYCDRNPSTWVWIAGRSIEGLSPDDAANRVLKDDNGMARLRLGCEGAMEVSR